MNAKPAAEPWRTDEPPKDGRLFLAWRQLTYQRGLYLVRWDQVMNRWGVDGTDFWLEVISDWAEINLPEEEEK